MWPLLTLLLLLQILEGLGGTPLPESSLQLFVLLL
jgi:hypothetical protein